MLMKLGEGGFCRLKTTDEAAHTGKEEEELHDKTKILTGIVLCLPVLMQIMNGYANSPSPQTRKR